MRIETQFGDIGIRKAGSLGYSADLNPDREFPEHSAYGATPVIALLALREALLLRTSIPTAANVVKFPTRKCQICLKPLRHGLKGVHFEYARSTNGGDELEAA